MALLSRVCPRVGVLMPHFWGHGHQSGDALPLSPRAARPASLPEAEGLAGSPVPARPGQRGVWGELALGQASCLVINKWVARCGVGPKSLEQLQAGQQGQELETGA